MPETEFEDRVGTWLRGKWKLDRLIAVGGMAGVYAATHKIGRHAAIKLLRVDIAGHQSIRERFEQEAAAVNNVGHHAVVQILDVDEDEEGTPFLVMELLEGETLADRVEREKKLKTDLLLDIVDQLLDVLVACHKWGIIHRDIKPENLFLQTNGRLKVLDFGIARVREGVRTVAGTMLGTVAFMPPEQLKGKEIDPRADLFAVGATMFAVLAGRRIHLAKDDTELAAKMLTTPAPRLASVCDAPEPVCLVVDRALAYLPQRRYPDAQTMRGDVWAARRGERPPYAHACERAGQAPDVLHEEQDKKPTSKTKPDRPTPHPLPSTDPQMPVFISDKAGSELPATDPQMPVFASDDGGRAAPLAPPADANEDDADGRDADEGAGEGDDGDSPEVNATDAEPSPSKSPDTDERWPPGEDEIAAKEQPSAPTAGEDAPKRDAAPRESERSAEFTTASDERDGKRRGESDAPPRGASKRVASEPPSDESLDDASPDDDDEPASEEPPSLPPQGEPPPLDAEAVARRKARSYGVLVLVLLVLGVGAYAAWYADVFEPPKKPAPTPRSISE